MEKDSAVCILNLVLLLFKGLRMKKIIAMPLALLFLALFAWNCDSGPKPIPIEKLETHNDAITGFSIKYPANWMTSDQPGKRYVAFTNEQTRERFIDYNTNGFPGGKVDLIVMDIDTNRTFLDILEASKIFAPELYTTQEVTINGNPMHKLAYEFELEGGLFKGETYVGTKDSIVATVVTIESFDNTWEMYGSQFEEIVNSIQLAQKPENLPDTITVSEEAEPPSENLTAKSGQGFTVRIPENFNAERLNTQGTEYSVNYIGDRRGDCNIQVDILDSKGQTDLAKIVNDLKGSYSNASAPKEIQLGGKSAYSLNYQPTSEVKSRVYFALHNDKLYRITMNWYVPEQNDYLPVFEKSVSTLKFQ